MQHQMQTQYLPGPVIAQPVSAAYGQGINYPAGVATVQPHYLDRIPVAIPIDQNRDMGIWSDDLCDCFDNVSSCCWSCWLPPWRWALTLSRAEILRHNHALFYYGSLWAITVILLLILLFVSNMAFYV